MINVDYENDDDNYIIIHALFYVTLHAKALQGHITKLDSQYNQNTINTINTQQYNQYISYTIQISSTDCSSSCR